MPSSNPLTRFRTLEEAHASLQQILVQAEAIALNLKATDSSQSHLLHQTLLQARATQTMLAQQTLALHQPFSAPPTQTSQLPQIVADCRPLFDASTDAMWWIENGLFIDCNPAAVEMLGYDSRVELLAVHPSKLSPERQPDGKASFEKANEMMATALEQGSHRFEWMHRRANGEDFWAEVLLTAIEHDGRQLIHTTWRDISERKQRDAELHEQTQFLRSTYEGVDHSITIIDVTPEGDFRFADWNPTTTALTGIARSTVIGKTPEELLGDVYGAQVRQNYQRCLEAHGPITYEEYLPLAGRDHWWLTTLNPLKDGNGRIDRIVLTTFEITEQKQTESALQQKESQYRSIFESINDGIFIQDIKTGALIDVNPATCKMHGYSYEEFMQLGPTDYVHPDSLPIFARFVETIQAGQRFTAEAVDLHKDGSPITIEVASIPFHYGDFPCALSVVRDISDRKRLEAEQQEAEAELKEANSFLNSVLEAIPGFFFAKDQDGKYITLNSNLADFYRHSISEVIGKTDFDFFPAEIAEAMIENDREVMARGDLQRFEEAVPISPSEIGTYLSTKAPLRNATGDVIGMIGLAQDISDRKAMEVSLRESEQRFRDVTEAAGEYIWEITPDGIYTFVTEQAKAVKGYGPDDLLGHTPFEFMPPEDIPHVEAIVQNAAKNKSVFKLEHRDVLPSGEVVWEAVSGIPILDGSGEITGFRGTGLSITDRKLAEMQIAESEAKFRRLVENASDLLYEIDTDGQFIYLSPQLTKIWGYATDDLINQPFAPLVHPDDLPRVMESTQALLVTGQRQNGLEFRIRHQDGHWIWVTCNSSPTKNADQQVTSFQGIARDISDRKLAEMQIADSEAKFRRLVENSNDLIYVVDADYCFTYLSPQFTEMWGYAVEAFINQPFAPLIHPDDMPIAIDSIQTMFATGERQTEIELRTLHQDGTLFWITCTNMPIKNDQGQVIGWQGTARDISERKTFEEAQARLTAILDTTSDFVGISNMDGEQLYMNSAGRRMLEISANLDIVGLHLETHLPDWAKSVVLEEGIPTAVRDGVWQGETALLTHTGRELPVSQVIIAHKGVDGEVEYLSTIVRDITAQKQAEVALKQKAEELEQALDELQRTQLQMIQSEKMSSLGQLVAGVAHEINNPVNFIHGNIAPLKEYTQDLIDLVELYQETYPNPSPDIEEKIAEIDLEFLQEDSPRVLASMTVGTERIRQIVGSLKNFSRLDEAECKEANIHEGLDSTLLILEHRIKATPERPAVEIEKDYGDLPLVKCYPGQLNQVFMNILANALDAMEERDRPLEAIQQQPSTIRIQTRRMGADQVVIAIADNGPGIPEKTRQRIFDPFFTTKAVGKGTGIGMSISHQIITEKHGGQIQCLSQPGQGAEFIIQIPYR